MGLIFDSFDEQFVYQNTTPESRRNIIKAWLPSLIDNGLNQTDSLSLFRDKGVGIRSSDFGAMFKDESARYNQAIKSRYVNMDKFFSDDSLADTPFATDTRYRFKLEYDRYDELTGEAYKGHFIFDTDTRMTREDLETIVSDILREKYGISDMSDRGATVRYGYINRSIVL